VAQGGPPPTPLPANLGPRAITLETAGAIAETREITTAVLGPVAYSPDGRILAVGVNRAINLRDATTLDELEPPRRLEGHTSQVFTLAFSPDSKLLASGGYMGDNVIRLWDPSDGSLVRELNGHTDWIRAVAFSPDGKLLASGSYDRTVRVWDVASGAVVRTLSGHAAFISTVAFAPDGASLASSAADGIVRMWDVETGEPRAGFSYELSPDLASGRRLWATGLAFTPDGKLLAVGSEDGSTALVEAATGKLIRTLAGHTDIVVSRGVAFAPDGKTLATASFDGDIRLWDVASGTQTAEFTRHGLRVLSIAFSPDGAYLASTSDQGGHLYVWDVKQPENARTLRVGQGVVTWMTFAPDSNVLGTVGANGSTQLHALDRDVVQALVGAASIGKSLAFANASRIVSISDDGQIGLIDTGSQEARVLAGLDGRPLNVVASPDGKLIVAGSATGAIGRWDGASGAAMPLLRGEQLAAITDLAVNDDGSLIAAGGPIEAGGQPGDPRIELWDAESGTLRHTLAVGSARIVTLAFQPRGKLLAATDLAGELRLWNADDGTLIKTISATSQQGSFTALAFSPDGKLLVTGTPNGQIIFWNAETGEQAAALPSRDIGIFTAAFSPDGQRLALGFADQTVRIFEVQQ
jgi:WD40 repeat protein